MTTDDDNYDDDGANDDSEPHILGMSSVAEIQKYALVMYGRWIAHLNNAQSDDEKAATRQKYLSMQETEQIVREYSNQYDEHTFSIGGETEEEVGKNMRQVLAALMDRIMSNVLQEGVNTGLLECAFDDKVNDFTFDVTEEGRARAREYFQKRTDDTAD